MAILNVLGLKTLHVKTSRLFGKEIWVVLSMRRHGNPSFLKMGFISGRLEVNLSNIKFSTGTTTHQLDIKCALVKMICVGNARKLNEP